MYDPAIRKIKLTSLEGKRFKKLGDIGESIADELLLTNGFDNVKNLNDVKVNFPFADFLAEKEGNRYLISVKTRNKYERSGKLNSRYKLGSKVYEHIQSLLAQNEWENCIPAWIAIAIGPCHFDGYFGTIAQLSGGRGINMSNKAVQNYLQLAKDMEHNYDFSEFGNIYEAKC